LAWAWDNSKVRPRVPTDEADRLIGLLRGSATVAQDPDDPPRAISRDPKDDYLVALAASTRSILVTGGADLLELRARIPVMSSREFLERLDT
jgi:predicted nucleic acid-binding protein